MVTTAVAESLVLSGSAVSELTVAVGLAVPAVLAVTVTCNTTVLPTGIEPVEQLIVCPSPQDVGGAVAPFKNWALTKVTPAGSVSVILTFCAACGPAFWYV